MVNCDCTYKMFSLDENQLCYVCNSTIGTVIGRQFKRVDFGNDLKKFNKQFAQCEKMKSSIRAILNCNNNKNEIFNASKEILNPKYNAMKHKDLVAKLEREINESMPGKFQINILIIFTFPCLRRHHRAICSEIKHS